LVEECEKNRVLAYRKAYRKLR